MMIRVLNKDGCTTSAALTSKLRRLVRALFIAQPRHLPSDKLHETRRLAESYAREDCEVVFLGRARNFTPSVGWYFGSGSLLKLQACGVRGKELFVNAALTGIQIRNLETKLQCRVLDRVRLIVEIFAHRAQTKEARLQVELASLHLTKTRLIRSLDAVGLPSTFGLDAASEVVSGRERASPSAVKGGMGGGGGQGEKEIALHRFRLAKQEKRIRSQIDQVRKTRDLHRRGRLRHRVPVVAVVGYTNAGKSTLMGQLTNCEMECDDLYFKTLDPISRKVQFQNGGTCIMSDTVGFISDLPVCLFAAFRATLEEATYANIILHVIDANATDWKNQRQQVYKTLQEIGVDQDTLKHRTIEVYNKIDRLKVNEHLSLIAKASWNRHQLVLTTKDRFTDFLSCVRQLRDEEKGFHPKCLFVSALDGNGMIQLKNAVQALVTKC